MHKSQQLKDSVKDMRGELASLVERNEEIIGLVSGDTNDGNINIEIQPGQKEAFQANLGRIKELRTLIEGAEATLDGKDFLSGPAHASAAVASAATAASFPQHKSIGQMFLESDEFKSLGGGTAGYTMRTPWTLKVADFAGRGYKSSSDIYTALPTGTPGDFGTVMRDAMVGRPHRTWRIRDLFPVVTTDARVIEYFRVSGFTNAASGVAERSGTDFVAKPQSALSFVGEQSTVRTIAHYVAVHRNTLADEPQLQAVIDNELLYGLQLREDQQILNGAGTSEDLKGIFNVSGINTHDANEATPDDTNEEAIRKAITKVALSEYEATGVVMHPSNWQTIELLKDDNGQYVNAVVAGIASGAEPRVWRLPVVVSQAIEANTALVGAFGLGATLYDREEANIRIAEQHDDFFIKNAVAVLAEQRVALTVQRPEAFCKVTNLD